MSARTCLPRDRFTPSRAEISWCTHTFLNDRCVSSNFVSDRGNQATEAAYVFMIPPWVRVAAADRPLLAWRALHLIVKLWIAGGALPFDLYEEVDHYISDLSQASNTPAHISTVWHWYLEERLFSALPPRSLWHWHEIGCWLYRGKLGIRIACVYSYTTEITPG